MTRAAIKHGEEQLRVAVLACDIEALDSLLDDALVLAEPDGDVVGKEAVLEAFRAGDLRITRLESRGLAVELFGDGVGVATALADVAGTARAHSIDGTFRHVRTWSRSGHGAWQVIASAILHVT